jgi:hypothetical protein
MGDQDAIKMLILWLLIEGLPGLYCVIGDCAYTASEHLIPIYRERWPSNPKFFCESTSHPN